MKKHNKYNILGFKALQRAAIKVAVNAQKNNYKIPVWKNDRIEYEIPEIIIEQASAPNAKSRGAQARLTFSK